MLLIGQVGHHAVADNKRGCGYKDSCKDKRYFQTRGHVSLSFFGAKVAFFYDIYVIVAKKLLLLPKIMSTILYQSPIFGPVHSRRLGVSLGINLMPSDGKVCTFDCIYCECGLNADHRPSAHRPTRDEVRTALKEVLSLRHTQGEPLDVITFAGNGEPTAHPDFPGIIRDTIAIRDRFFPQAKVSVLSNATMIHRPAVREALMLVDNNIQKLDTVDAAYINKVDRPVSSSYDVREVIESLKAFNGHVIIQTMFMKGDDVDNTGEYYVAPWIEAVKEIAPQQVMIYTIDRETPVSGLEKADKNTLDAIRDRVRALGIPCSASY